MPSSRTHFFIKSEQFKFACLELSKRSKRSRFIWEEIQLRTRVTSKRDGAVVDSIVNPVERHADGASDLRHGEIAVDLARMGLSGELKNAVPQADSLNGADDEPGAHRRAKALGRELLGNVFIAATGAPV